MRMQDSNLRLLTHGASELTTALIRNILGGYLRRPLPVFMAKFQELVMPLLILFQLQEVFHAF